MTDEELGHYSAALDEILRLRRALAYEAGVTNAHLQFKSFPKSRRAMAEEQVRRMQQAARAGATMAYCGTEDWALRSAMSEARAEPTLTRHGWEHRYVTPGQRPDGR